MADMFDDLPPPSAPLLPEKSPVKAASSPSPAPAPAPAAPLPALKSALKRSKPADSQQPDAAEASQKRIRFKTTTDASEEQVIQATKKITSHISNPSKFGKASKLAIQLFKAGSVRQATCDYFFAILEAAMASPSACTDPLLRTDYQALFIAAQEVSECFNKRQKNQLTAWALRAVVANELHTDDSFVFAKATGKIKAYISDLPVATEEDDQDEAAVLARAQSGMISLESRSKEEETHMPAPSLPNAKEDSDPFGLDILISSKSKKDLKTIDRKEGTMLSSRKIDEEETKRFLRSLREALIFCLDIAAKRYKLPWTQTGIDILVKHAFDNIEKFTCQQRIAIEKLWTSIREQQTRRKQGKSVTGKLDMNAFEWLQDKYANEKISIRHAVGGSGERKAEQWLG